MKDVDARQKEPANANNSATAQPIDVLWNQLARTASGLVLGFDANAIAWASLFIQVQFFAVHADVSGTPGRLCRWIGRAGLRRP